MPKRKKTAHGADDDAPEDDEEDDDEDDDALPVISPLKDDDADEDVVTASWLSSDTGITNPRV
jgi:hypothetical protein